MVWSGRMRTLIVNSPSCHCICWWRCWGWPWSWGWQWQGDKYAGWGEFWKFPGLHLKDEWHLQEGPCTVGTLFSALVEWRRKGRKCVFHQKWKLLRQGWQHAVGGWGSEEEWARRGECDVVEEIASGQAWGQVSESVEHSDRGGFPGLATGHLQSRRVQCD